MIKFLIGVLVGGIVGFLASAVLSINNSEKDERQPTPISKEIGDNDAPSK